MEELQQRANEGQHLPQSMGMSASGKAARAGARRLKSPAYLHQEPVSPSGETSVYGLRSAFVAERRLALGAYLFPYSEAVRNVQ